MSVKKAVTARRESVVQTGGAPDLERTARSSLYNLP